MAQDQATSALDYLEIDEVAALLGLKPQTIRHYIARREIPFVKLGRRTVFLRESLADWLRGKEQKPHGSHQAKA